MSDVGSILALSAFLAVLLSVGATVLHGLATGCLYYEPSCPPIVFRERPVKFFVLLTFDSVVIGFLVLGCVKIGRSLF